ncbi:oxidoreductase, partial [Streptomyces sp. SID10116]|nr:oxidoreductase [Streptomyces sp. SID10116]
MTRNRPVPRADWNGRRRRVNASHQPDPRDRPARLTVGVVGAGRVGPALAASLQLAGHRPVAASGVSDASVR